MGVRAILQKGRTKKGLVLPADAQAKVNEVNDRSTLEKWANGEAPGGNVQVKPAGTSPLANTTAPTPVVDKETENGEVSAKREDDTLQTGVLTAEGTVVKGGEIEGDKVVGGTEKEVPDDLTKMEGIGEAGEQKLYEAGFTTYESIADSNPAAMAEAVSGVSEDSAKGLIKQARKLAKLKAKGK